MAVEPSETLKPAASKQKRQRKVEQESSEDYEIQSREEEEEFKDDTFESDDEPDKLKKS